jgi:excisionase family DNA binding protein
MMQKLSVVATKKREASGAGGQSGSGVVKLKEKISNKLLTVNEVANILRVSNMTVYRLVKSGQIPAIRVGKNYRIKESDVNKYLSRGSQ